MKAKDALRILFWLCIGIAIGWGLLSPRRKPQPPVPEYLAEQLRTASVSCFSYPHALIPCGARSNQEVQIARMSDASLDRHYGDVGTLRPATLTRDQSLYASFRSGTEIVWTATKIAVRAGEVVLSDSAGNQIRGRCGNRLSAEARFPAMPLPPEMVNEVPTVSLPEAPEIITIQRTVEALVGPLPSMPAVPVELPPGRRGPIVPVPTWWPTGGTPVVPGLPAPIVSIIIAPIGPTTGAVAPSSIPEPGTWWLAGGLIGAAMLWRTRAR